MEIPVSLKYSKKIGLNVLRYRLRACRFYIYKDPVTSNFTFLANLFATDITTAEIVYKNNLGIVRIFNFALLSDCLLAVTFCAYRIQLEYF